MKGRAWNALGLERASLYVFLNDLNSTTPISSRRVNSVDAYSFWGVREAHLFSLLVGQEPSSSTNQPFEVEAHSPPIDSEDVLAGIDAGAGDLLLTGEPINLAPVAREIQTVLHH